MNEHSELVRLLRSMSDDLTTMLRIKVVSGATGNCAAPIALYSLTSMGFVGYLISPEKLPVYDHTQQIMACIEYGRRNGDITAFDTRLDANTVTELYAGLAFYFVPLSIGIGRGLEGLFVPVYPGDRVAMDADRLAHMLVRFIRELEGVMLTDSDLCVRMWERLMSFRKVGRLVE